jgi:hypothetical protein
LYNEERELTEEKNLNRRTISMNYDSNQKKANGSATKRPECWGRLLMIEVMEDRTIMLHEKKILLEEVQRLFT